MKTYINCKHAAWNRTARGRLSPVGSGRCLYEYRVPPLPASRYWIGEAPVLGGGNISRREEHRDHCPYYLLGEDK